MKGTKKGKGKKEKKKAAEPFERRKPKLDELKVPASSALLMRGVWGGRFSLLAVSCCVLQQGIPKRTGE